jgi:uncharacterized protein involved in outer membrane biogenesis
MKLLSVLLASVLTALLLVLALSVTALLFRQPIVNSDPVRTEITELARRLTGRSIIIEGDISIIRKASRGLHCSPGSASH